MECTFSNAFVAVKPSQCTQPISPARPVVAAVTVDQLGPATPKPKAGQKKRRKSLSTATLTSLVEKLKAIAGSPSCNENDTMNVSVLAASAVEQHTATRQLNRGLAEGAAKTTRAQKLRELKCLLSTFENEFTQAWQPLPPLPVLSPLRLSSGPVYPSNLWKPSIPPVSTPILVTSGEVLSTPTKHGRHPPKLQQQDTSSDSPTPSSLESDETASDHPAVVKSYRGRRSGKSRQARSCKALVKLLQHLKGGFEPSCPPSNTSDDASTTKAGVENPKTPQRAHKRRRAVKHVAGSGEGLLSLLEGLEQLTNICAPEMKKPREEADLGCRESTALKVLQSLALQPVSNCASGDTSGSCNTSRQQDSVQQRKKTSGVKRGIQRGNPETAAGLGPNLNFICQSSKNRRKQGAAPARAAE